MTVSVANKILHARGNLSDLGALALAFIDGGTEWLAWAISAPSTKHSFPDEMALISQVQQGLHASPMTFLPGLELMVSPVKLLTLSLGDLRTLARAEDGAQDAATMAQMRAILSAHGLLTQSDLAAVPAFLSSLGVAGTALFRCLDFSEMAGLYELISVPQPQDGPSDLRNEAASFALQQARTPMEFADYYRAYLALVAKRQIASIPAEPRLALATATVSTLLPLLFDAIDCPRVDGLASPAEVGAAINDWTRQGRRIGFSRLSEGVCRIIDSSAFTTETGSAAQAVVNQYLTDAQSFLSSNPPQGRHISQDGRSCLLPASSRDFAAEMLVGPDGGVTLRQFRRIPAPAN